MKKKREEKKETSGACWSFEPEANIAKKVWQQRKRRLDYCRAVTGWICEGTAAALGRASCLL
jgi:Pyruvate/2-oxoacid:ferredoxin oxidoreductase delta subunit